MSSQLLGKLRQEDCKFKAYLAYREMKTGVGKCDHFGEILSQRVQRGSSKIKEVGVGSGSCLTIRVLVTLSTRASQHSLDLPSCDDRISEQSHSPL